MMIITQSEFQQHFALLQKDITQISLSLETPDFLEDDNMLSEIIADISLSSKAGIF